MFITASVGKGGRNISDDVKLVQETINLIAELDYDFCTLIVDGKSGKNTYNAIQLFQKKYVKLKTPDARIDVGGRTEKYLVAKAKATHEGCFKDLLQKYKVKKKAYTAAELNKGPKTIVFRTHARKELSLYTQNIVKLAMSIAGINRCDISTTLRTFDDQARIMYNNCSAYSNATSVDTLRSLRGWGYREAGRAVEKVYFEKKSEGEAVTLKAMKEKIEALYKAGDKVSLHCVSKSDFIKRNVLDIPYSSVTADKRRSFETALMGMTKDIKNIRYEKPIQGEIYVDRLIIEDRCWHLEIVQSNKPLPNMQKNVSTVAKTGKTLKRPQGQTARSGASKPTDIFNNFLCFLDDWF